MRSAYQFGYSFVSSLSLEGSIFSLSVHHSVHSGVPTTQSFGPEPLLSPYRSPALAPTLGHVHLDVHVEQQRFIPTCAY